MEGNYPPCLRLEPDRDPVPLKRLWSSKTPPCQAVNWWEGIPFLDLLHAPNFVKVPTPFLFGGLGPILTSELLDFILFGYEHVSGKHTVWTLSGQLTFALEPWHFVVLRYILLLALVNCFRLHTRVTRTALHLRSKTDTCHASYIPSARLSHTRRIYIYIYMCFHACLPKQQARKTSLPITKLLSKNAIGKRTQQLIPFKTGRNMVDGMRRSKPAHGPNKFGLQLVPALAYG